MADILLDVQSVPTTPGAGQAVLYVDSSSKKLSVKNDAGFVETLGLDNFSIAAQVIPATTRTYIIGSALAIPSGKLQIGSRFEWNFDMTKTAAGIAASTIDVCVGTTGTTADTARVSFTKPAGTAVIDNGDVTIGVICRGPLSASGIFAGGLTMTHNLAATGHATIPVVNQTTISSAFDVTTANLIVGLCITTGASDAITIQYVEAIAKNV